MSQSLFEPSEPTQPPPATQSKPPSRLRFLAPAALTLAIAGTAAGIWYILSRPTETALKFSGRVEGYETKVDSRIEGRVASIEVREGDAVRKGQVVAKLDDAQLQSQFQAAAARIAAAQQQEQQARAQIAAIENQIRLTQQNPLQMQPTNQGQRFQAESNLAALEAQLKQAEAQLNLAKLNRDRLDQLLREGAVTRQQLDQAETAYQSIQATVEAIQKQVEAAKGGLAVAQNPVSTPPTQNLQLAALMQQRQQLIAQVQAAQTEIKNALTLQKQLQAQQANLNITSPIDGVVTARTVEPGATIDNGKPLLSVTNLDSVYLRGFLPERKMAQVRVGQPARVYLNANPEQSLSARVAEVDAASTSGNTSSGDNSAQFGVKLSISNAAGYAKPGMPASAEIILDGGK